jgi:FAD-dependent urate hydroxylase
MHDGHSLAEDAAVDQDSLDALVAQLRRDLSYLNYPAKNWVKPLTPSVEDETFDVVTIGAGMVGLAVAVALRREGIQNSVTLDAAPAGLEGPWVTTARMRTLRSPKILLGPAMGIGSLTFRAWYVAQFGAAAWEALDKIPRVMWMDYLRWYRDVLNLPVRNDVRVDAIRWEDDRFLLDTVGPDGNKLIAARRVALATGRDGLGKSSLPPEANHLDPVRRAHTSDDIDFEGLAGKRIAVIGAGASAFDNAAVALENGAAEVRVLCRRPDIPRINKLTGIGSPGIVHGWYFLPDAWKWRCLHYNDTCQTPPPGTSIRRVTDFPNGHVHTGCPILSMTEADGEVTIETPRGTYVCDYVIFGTGFRFDPKLRPELEKFADNILTWGESFVPPPSEQDEALASGPYLGPMFEFRERRAGATPGLDRLHCMNYAAALSHGKLTGDIPAVTQGANRFAQGVASAFLAEDIDHFYERLQAFDTPDVNGDEWTDEPLP